MPGTKNLKPCKPLDLLTPEERQRQIDLSVKGGIARANAYKKQKTLKEVAQMVLKMPVSQSVAEKYCGEYADGLDGKDLNLETLASISLMREVIENGNAKAYEVLRDTAGFSPKAELTLNGNLDVLTASDRAILAKMREKLPSFVQSADDSETD